MGQGPDPLLCEERVIATFPWIARRRPPVEMLRWTDATAEKSSMPLAIVHIQERGDTLYARYASLQVGGDR